MSKRKYFLASLGIFTVSSLVAAMIFALSRRYSSHSQGYEFLFLLPLMFGCSCVMNGAWRQIFSKKIGIFVLFTITTIRYVVAPLIVASSSFYVGNGSIPQPNSTRDAILFMIYELIVVNLAIAILHKWLYTNGESSNTLVDKANKSDKVFLMPMNRKIMLISVVMCGLVAIAAFPDVLNRYNNLLTVFRVYQGEGVFLNTDFERGPFMGIVILLFDWSRVIGTLLLISIFVDKYRRSGKKVYILLFVFALTPTILIVPNLNRSSFFIPILVSFYMANWIYGKYSLRINLILLSVAVAFVAISSSVKSFNTSTGAMSLNLLSHYSQIYFSGPRNVAIALETKSAFSSQISLLTFINDFLGSVPFISNFIDQSNRSNIYFNLQYHNISGLTSQIIPMIGQGYFFFSFLGAPVFSLVFTSLCMWFDRKTAIENRIEFKYLYAWGAVMTGAFYMYNLQIMVTFLVSTFLPLSIILTLNRRLVLRRSISFVGKKNFKE